MKIDTLLAHAESVLEPQLEQNCVDLHPDHLGELALEIGVRDFALRTQLGKGVMPSNVIVGGSAVAEAALWRMNDTDTEIVVGEPSEGKATLERWTRYKSRGLRIAAEVEFGANTKLASMAAAHEIGARTWLGLRSERPRVARLAQAALDGTLVLSDFDTPLMATSESRELLRSASAAVTGTSLRIGRYFARLITSTPNGSLITAHIGSRDGDFHRANGFSYRLPGLNAVDVAQNIIDPNIITAGQNVRPPNTEAEHRTLREHAVHVRLRELCGVAIALGTFDTALVRGRQFFDENGRLGMRSVTVAPQSMLLDY